jgi:glycerophosphoryl diester phosphodiesterase
MRKAFDAINRIKTNKVTYIEAHRGCNQEEHENTISAFNRAIEYNCDSVELDVWLTKDEVPVVIHGSESGHLQHIYNNSSLSTNNSDSDSVDLNESTDLLINNIMCKDLASYKVGPKRRDHIPTLEATLILCKDKIFINIEIKDYQYSLCFKRIYELILKYEMIDSVAISSFKHQYWNEIQNIKGINQIEFGFLYDTTENQKVEFIYENRSGSTINVWYKQITKEFVQRAHDNGIGVLAWFCLDDKEDEHIYRFMFECGVDVLCCNKPNNALVHRELFFSSKDSF